MLRPNNKYRLKSYLMRGVCLTFLAAAWFFTQFIWFLAASKGDIFGMIATLIFIGICIYIVFMSYLYQQYYTNLHKFLNYKPKPTAIN